MCVTLENDVCEMKSMYFCFSMSELLVFLKGCYISKKKKLRKCWWKCLFPEVIYFNCFNYFVIDFGIISFVVVLQ